MNTLRYHLDSGVYVEYDLEFHSNELDRLCDVRLEAHDKVLSVFEDYISNGSVSQRVFIDKDVQATTSFYNIKGDYVRMSASTDMNSPLFLAVLIHELSHSRQALESFWKDMLYDYDAVMNSEYVLNRSKLVSVASFLPEVKQVFDENSKMHTYFDELDSISCELNNLSYPLEPRSSLWARLTGDYRKQFADYEAQKLEVYNRLMQLEQKRLSLPQSYNKVMCDRLPSLLVEFDANKRTFDYIDGLRSRGFALPENFVDSETGEAKDLKKRLEHALGYWVDGDFKYPKDFAGVAKLCN